MAQIRGNTQIKSGTIENDQIAAAAAIAFSKLATLTSGNVLLGNGSGVATSVAITGDISINNAGVVSITTGSIVDADINASAAIATSKLADGASFLFKDGSVSMTGNLDVNSNKIINLAQGTSAGDAVNKEQLDAAISLATTGLNFKAAVRVATTANITLSNEQTIDGIAAVAGDRVLVKNQSTASENGLYTVVNLGAWTRTSDADISSEVKAGMFVLVEEGTTNADSAWVLSTDNAITLGSTSLTFNKFLTLNDLSAGAGLTKTGNTLDVVSGNGGIVVNPDNITLTVDATADSLSVGAGGVKLKDGTSGQIYVANGSGVFKRVTIGGDATLASDGTLTVSGGGLSASNFVFNEIPSGSINGSNAAFTLANTPTSGTVSLFLNGVLLVPTTDYTVSSNTITFVEAPTTGDNILVNYMK